MEKTVAIVGYSFRFPGTTKAQFWQDLLDKKDLITEVSDDRWAKESYLHPDKRHPGTSYSFAAGSLGDIAGFDAGFFGLSPREVQHMDPQQRLLLEMTWEAIESANIPAADLRGSECGVYMGVAAGDFADTYADDPCAIEANTATGSTNSIAANRISYLFDLHGPSLAIDTACSSSMVAFHQACRAIQTGDVPMALAGGISIHAHPSGFLVFSKATMLSPTGRCHVFDADADGYVRSEGGGVFLLKDYQQAKADGDRIIAVVAGTAVNTDGNKSGLTIPNPNAQIALMERVYQQAGIAPDAISYLEAHGTGTPVGDPIEVQAISTALGSKRRTPLPIGSVKSNLGHLETASGVAGLVKALLTIEHRQVPATISMKTPNPNIPFAQWNVQVVTEALTLPESGPLTIGINSFGFGGANAHVILQSEPVNVEASRPVNPTAESLNIPLQISARSPDALKAQARQLASYLAESPASVYDIGWTLIQRREHHDQGALLFTRDRAEAQARLTAFAETGEAEGVYLGDKVPQAKGPAFVYSGNGCQWETMGRQLLQESDVFRESIHRVDAIFQRYADFSILSELQGDNGLNRFQRTEIAQPALFALQVGLTDLLAEQGIVPQVVTGHSVGEVAAAWASGALTLEQAVKVIYHRSLHQGTTAGQGQMTAVALSADAIQAWLDKPEYQAVQLSGVNSPNGVTLAGEEEALTRLEIQLKGQGVRLKRLDLDYAFHSAQMDSIEAGVREDLADLTPSATQTTYISTVTGEVFSGESLDAEYWWHNIRYPVQFEKAINSILDQGINTFIEIGAHPVLSGYLREVLRGAEHPGQAIATLMRQQDRLLQVEQAVAQCLLSGAVNDLSYWFPVEGQSVALPTYPWQREAYWHATTSDSQGLLSRYPVHPLLGYRTSQRQPTWQNDLDTQRFPWLADHKVGDGVVFPGAGFVELVLAAITELRGEQLLAIEDLEILSPLLLDDQHTKRVQIQMDPQSGAVQVFSQEKLRADDWSLHLKARALKETLGTALEQPTAMVPQRTADFSRADHLQLAASIGLDYGPAFQAISEGWIDGNSVLGKFDLPDIIQSQLPNFWLHPGVLDSAFQLFIQLLKEQLSQHQGIAFVPTQIAAITLDTSETERQPGFTRVTLLKHSPHSLLARVEIFTTDLRPLVVLEGVRFRAVPLRRSLQQVISHLNYVTVPVALSAQAFDAASDARWQAQLLNDLRQQPELQTYVEETEPLLDALVESFVLHMLAEQADEQGVIKHWPTNASARRWLAQAKSEGWLAETADGRLQQLQPHADVAPDIIWNMLIQEYPAYAALTQRVGSSGRRLLQRLQDDQDASPSDALGYAQALRMMLGEQTLSMLGVAYSKRLVEQQQKLARTERLRIVEISSGQPLLMDAICRKLDFNLCDYTYLTSNPDTLAELQPHSQDYPLMQLGRFDPVTGKVTLPLPDSLAPIHQVFIHLDFISLSDVQAILRQLRSALHPQAQLMLLAQQPALWLDYAFGHTENWWVSEDQSQQASPEQWQELLQELGYQQVSIERLTSNSRGAVMLMARAPQAAVVQPALESWFLLSDNTPQQQLWTNALQAALQPAGIQVDIIDTAAVSAESASQIGQLIAEPIAASATQDKVRWLLLSGLGDTELVEGQTRRCRLAAELVRHLEWHDIAEDTRVMLLTRQVAAGYVPGLASDSPAADHAFWGFGRTLINESAKIPVALIDLPLAVDTLQPCADTLLELGRGQQLEDEVFIMAEGGCVAPRLRNLTRPAVATKECAEAALPTRVLSFDLPGQLRNLYWKSVRLPVPTAKQVVVEVKATGLNFRDVMFALGLLSDEAIENGFSGPTLGLEFSGVVIEVGKEVTEFKVGDRVVGFGPASFTTRVCTGINSITRMPESFDFAAAATIPTTFFTVYYALKHLARLEPGERLLIHGAAGGVGLAAIQIARLMGAEIYATVGSESKQDFISLLGENRLYDSRSVTFAEAILNDTPDGQGVDVVLNSLAGEAINQNLRVLKPFGRFLELGKRDFYENTAIGLRPFRNNISYFGIDTDQLMKVRPDLTQRLFSEMMALFESGELYPLPFTQFHADQVVDAFRFMQQARQIGKVIITYPQPPHAKLQTKLADPLMDSGLLLDAQGAYLVTGGLSGFGLKTAHWLVEKGARKLVLISRSGQVPEQDQASLDALKAQGVDLLIRACDVTDHQALADLLEETTHSLAPLKGVVHAAAYYHDGLIHQLSDSEIADVLRVKMQGAQYLHELTDNLDLFVLFSSATTLFGNPGQASYVAANHWLEGLAMSRYHQGLPVTCVRWGAIDDVGYLARHSKIKEALEGRMGGHALDSAQALIELEKLLQSGQPLTAVMELEWQALARFLPGANAAKYRELVATAQDQEGGEDHLAELQLMLDTLEPEALQEQITQILKVQLSKILLIAEEKLEVNRSVYEMGFDSLMAVELVTAIENRFGVQLPVMALSESPTLTQLAQRLISLLKGDEQDNVSDADQLKLQIAQQYEVTEDLALNSSTAELKPS